jgi:hypothetical protein
MQISSLFRELISIKTTIYSIVISSCCRIHQAQSSIAFENSGDCIYFFFLAAPFAFFSFGGPPPLSFFLYSYVENHQLRSMRKW